MTIKVIATDMDGTLLDARGQLDLPRLEKILDQLDEATKERIDTAYKEMNEHVGLKWD